MSFKKFGRLALFLFALYYMVACSLRTEEEAYKPEVVKIDKEFSCIDNVGDKFEKYFKSALNSDEVIVFFDCAIDAMKMFKDNTRSKQGASYSPDVLRDFLHKFFLRKNHITDTLLDEGMKIKVTMVGGKADLLTKKEIQRGVELLEIIKQQALKVLPFMKFFNFNTLYKNKTFSLSAIGDLEKGFEILQGVASVFGSELAKNKAPYGFESFKTFLLEFRKFLNWESTDYAKEEMHDTNLTDWVDLGKQAKQTLFESDEMSIQVNEWTPYLRQLFGWYSIVLRYKYTVRELKSGSLFVNPGLGNLNKMVRDIKFFGKKAIAYHLDGNIEHTRLAKLYYALDRLSLIPFGISAQTLENIIPIYVKRAFVDIKKRQANRVNTGVTLEVASNLFKEFDLWHEVQSKLAEYKQPGSDSVVQFPSSFIRMDLNSCTHENRTTRGDSAICELKRIQSQRPMFESGFKTAHLIQDSQLKKTYDFINLSYLNVVRIAVRLLILAYGSYDGSKNMAGTLNQNGITIDQMNQFYTENQNLGADLGFMDRNNVDGGSSSFKEGKLFTYAGKGYLPDNPKDLITYDELTQLISLLYSGGRIGINIFNDLKDDKTGTCKESEEVDDYNNKKILFDCFNKNIRQFLLPSIESMPAMYEHLIKLPEVEFNELMHLFYNAVFENDYDYKYVESGNLTKLMTIMHYIETTMTRFDDFDKDGVMRLHEADRAFEVYKTLFEQLDGLVGKEPHYVKAAFYLFLTRTEAQDRSVFLLGQKIRWNLSLGEEFEDMQIDRSQLIRVFVIIINSLDNSNEEPILPPEKCNPNSIDCGRNPPFEDDIRDPHSSSRVGA